MTNPDENLNPISEANLERLAEAGVVVERCERCAGVGALTSDGVAIPKVLRLGRLRCPSCGTSTLRDGDRCDCCPKCGASPDEMCIAGCLSFSEDEAA